MVRMQMIHGIFLGTTTRKREYEGRSWDETTAHVLDGVRTTECTLAKDFDPSTLPSINDEVLFETYSRGAANKRVYVTALRVLDPSRIFGLAGV
jgi:hypothetical protein